MKKSVFRLIDLVSFGIPALIATVGSIWMAISGFESEASPAEVLGLMFTVSAAMWGIYGLLLFWRWKFIQSIDFVTKHGWNVVTDGLNVTKEEIEAEVDRTLSLWKEKSGLSDEIMKEAVEEINSDWMLFCKPDKIQHMRLGKLAGYVTGKNIVVGFIGAREIEKTALAHETGHIIHKAYVGAFDNKMCHRFMNNKGLP